MPEMKMRTQSDNNNRYIEIISFERNKNFLLLNSLAARFIVNWGHFSVERLYDWRNRCYAFVLCAVNDHYLNFSEWRSFSTNAIIAVNFIRRIANWSKCRCLCWNHETCTITSTERVEWKICYVRHKYGLRWKQQWNRVLYETPTHPKVGII